MTRDDSRRPTLEAEVCVLGGGPAGSAAARKLALLGHSVVLVEAQAFPRPHVGESLPPSVLALLELLGVRDRVESAGFLRPRDALIRWPGMPTEAGDPLRAAEEPGFQVDRGRFDAILLHAAVDAGAHVLQPARASRPRRFAEGFHIAMAPHRGEPRPVVRARYLVDATGRRSSLWRPAPNGGRRFTSPRTLALYGYWRDTGLCGPQTRVEAGRDHWFWGAPLPDATFNATVFVDARRGLARERGVEALYRRLLAGSTLLKPCLNGRLTGPVRACDATPYHDPEPVFDGGIKIGEAAHAMDVLASQGVQAALRSGVQGAAVLHTFLSSPENAPAAREFHRQRHDEAVRLHHSLATEMYRSAAQTLPHPFWTVRGQPLLEPDPAPRPRRRQALPPADTAVQLSPQARLSPTPVLVGDTIAPRPALHLPGLPRPVAFSCGVPVKSLLDEIVAPATVVQVLERFQRHLDPSSAAQVLAWMWDQGVVEADPAFGARDRR